MTTINAEQYVEALAEIERIQANNREILREVARMDELLAEMQEFIDTSDVIAS